MLKFFRSSANQQLVARLLKESFRKHALGLRHRDRRHAGGGGDDRRQRLDHARRDQRVRRLQGHQHDLPDRAGRGGDLHHQGLGDLCAGAVSEPRRQHHHRRAPAQDLRPHARARHRVLPLLLVGRPDHPHDAERAGGAAGGRHTGHLVRPRPVLAARPGRGDGHPAAGAVAGRLHLRPGRHLRASTACSSRRGA